MNILAAIAGIVIALAFLAAGLAKVTKNVQMVEAAKHLGFSVTQFQLLGAAEIAGAAGVVAGIAVDSFAPLGIAAAVGLAAVGIGAGVVHRKAGDESKAAAPPIVLALLAIIYIVATAAA